ncbi:MAG: hypothetical protein GY913_06910 [Proteobacteria bacterium]|nr:hypothetical protein [Pseudomonadota bacterium]
MDSAEGLDDWKSAIAVAQEAGAVQVAAVNPPGELDGVVRLDRGDGRGVGLTEDWDGITRRWSMGTAAHPTFSGQVAQALGQGGRGERLIAVGGDAVPTVGVDNLTYLDPDAMEGRVVVLGETTPWAVPLVETAAGPMPLAEVLTRTTATTAHLPAPRFASALIGLFAGALAAGLLLQTTRRRRWMTLAPVAVVLSVVPFAVGVLLPVEVPLVTMVAGILAASTLRWISHSARFKALVDRAIWQLHIEPHTEDLERDWQELCRSAVDLGVAERVWAVEQIDGVFKTVAACGVAGELTLTDDAPPPFADPVVLELSSRCGRRGVLLIDPTSLEPDLRPLYAVAAHQGRKSRVSAPRLENVEAYISVGVGIVHAALDALLSDAKMIKSGAHARALFDPLGRLVNVDQKLEDVLFPNGRSGSPKLMDLWSVVGGTRGQVTGVMNGEGTIRMPHSSGCLLLLTASHDQGRLAGFVIEMVDGNTAAQRSGMLGPRLVSDGGRRVDRSA